MKNSNLKKKLLVCHGHRITAAMRNVVMGSGTFNYNERCSKAAIFVLVTQTMMEIFYHVADKFFYAFHVALILFNLFGWIPKSMRKWNLMTLLLTAFSWFVLGIFYGFGYCFLTDWHWQVRANLGHLTDSNSYIHFLITEMTPIDIKEQTVDLWTAILFFVSLGISIYVNVRMHRNNGKIQSKDSAKKHIGFL